MSVSRIERAEHGPDTLGLSPALVLPPGLAEFRRAELAIERGEPPFIPSSSAIDFTAEVGCLFCMVISFPPAVGARLFTSKGPVFDIIPAFVVTIVTMIQFEVGDAMEQPANIALPLARQDVEFHGQATKLVRDVAPDLRVDGRDPLQDHRHVDQVDQVPPGR
jgi:hypothetical protein